MEKEINKIISKYQNMENPLIMILHEVMDKYHYISERAMEEIAKKLNISVNEVYSVVTFYNDFKLKPMGQYQISVCTGTVCYINGSEKLLEELEKELKIKKGETTKNLKFSLNEVRCLGCCSMAPVIKINDKVYGNVKVSDIKNILKEYE